MKHLLLSAAAGVMVASAPTAAQEAVDDIVVTAQKREQSVQDVGISISAFSAEQLQTLGARSSIDVARLTPGVHISGSIGGQNSQFTIRGVTQADFADTLEAPVAVYVDEAYISMQQGQLFGLFDLDRVEVLKGPQGTLFGRNATGGLVHFITAKPTQELEGFADVTYGSYNQVRLEGAVSGPLTKTISARVSGYFNRHDSILKNEFPNGPDFYNAGQDFWNANTYAGRLQLRFEPNSDLDVLVSAYAGRSDVGIAPYQQAPLVPVFDAQGRQINSIKAAPGETRLGIGPGGIAVDLSGQPTTARRPTPGGDAFGFLDPDGAGPRTSDNYGLSRGNTFELFGFTGNVRWDLDTVDLTSITDYKHFDKDNFNDPDAGPVDQFGFFSVARTQQFSQEVRLSGASDGFEWVAGLYYLWIDAKVPRESIFVSPASILNGPLGGGGAPLDLRGIAAKETNSFSAFAQGQIALSNQLDLVVGIRGIKEKQKFDYRTGIYLGDTETLLVPGRTFNDRLNETLWAGKLQLEYHPNDDVLLYAGINRGVKAGAFNQPLFINGLPDSEIPYKGETLISYEAGWKTTLFDGTTRFNGSVYLYDYNDYQVFEIRVADNVVRNADARTYGAEIDLTTKPVEGLTLAFSAAAFDATVKGLSLNGVVRNVKPTFAPELQLFGSATYEWAALGGKLAAHADASYTDGFYYQIFNYDAQKTKSYALANLRLTYTDSSDRWRLEAFVENLFNKRYLTIAVDLATLCGCAQNAYGRPQWFGVGARYSF